ncbi:hypothetical protein CcaCcLH18_14082 [Colletotrichum camelliae]|nr:hypothetical protein CcaCcLH18_14082 [Colletotrichum camelliae]
MNPSRLFNTDTLSTLPGQSLGDLFFADESLFLARTTLATQAPVPGAFDSNMAAKFQVAIERDAVKNPFNNGSGTQVVNDVACSLHYSTFEFPYALFRVIAVAVASSPSAFKWFSDKRAEWIPGMDVYYSLRLLTVWRASGASILIHGHWMLDCEPIWKSATSLLMILGFPGCDVSRANAGEDPQVAVASKVTT